MFLRLEVDLPSIRRTQVPFGFANLRANNREIHPLRGGSSESKEVGNRNTVAIPELSARPASTASRQQSRPGRRFYKSLLAQGGSLRVDHVYLSIVVIWSYDSIFMIWSH